MKISPARVAAFSILSKIEREKAFSSVLLPVFEKKLNEKDRALCHEITLGVLRRQIYLDKVIEILTNGKKIETSVRIILRIGLYQLQFLDKIPLHAAVNDAVNLAQKIRKSSAKGFVNAVLRRFTRAKPQLFYKDEIERLAIETSHPRWLIEKWIRQFGFEDTAGLARFNNEPPGISFRYTARTASETRQRKEPATSKELLKLAEKGEIYFQDEGSQIVGSMVALRKDEKFLDVCAAPGSKTTQIGAKYKARAVKLFVAGDRHWHRIKILKENCRRQGIDFVQIVQYDAEKTLPFATECFDVVLVDAPCSGTGTIRHNPEIRYFLQEKDFRGFYAKQLKILRNASKLTKSGGKLIYSTCSLEPEENEAVAEDFLLENAEFCRLKPDLPDSFLTKQGFARTFPPRDKSDGFFIAVFAKR
jgi:16S rRNA (cytosine967-C5)-methyltransferase